MGLPLAKASTSDDELSSVSDGAALLATQREIVLASRRPSNSIGGPSPRWMKRSVG